MLNNKALNTWEQKLKELKEEKDNLIIKISLAYSQILIEKLERNQWEHSRQE